MGKREREVVGIKELCSLKIGTMGQRRLNSPGALNLWSSVPNLPKSQRSITCAPSTHLPHTYIDPLSRYLWVCPTPTDTP